MKLYTKTHIKKQYLADVAAWEKKHPQVKYFLKNKAVYYDIGEEFDLMTT